MSEIADSSGTPPAGGPQGSQSPLLFSAFQKQPPRRLWWALLLALPAVVGLCALALSRGERGVTEVVTPTGIRRVHEGMSPQEVVELLGRPIVYERSADGRVECYQHGLPTLEEPSFLVYELCYEGGQLRGVKQRRYSTWKLGEDGALIPPGADKPEPKAPPAPGAP